MPTEILLTNDDGIDAVGIRALADALSRDHDVTVVAPESNQSGVGGARSWWETTVD
ncbi:5'/3'-nucleotidase SurE, partial [Halorubrum sp. SD612]